jgi:hypothetical protein
MGMRKLAREVGLWTRNPARRARRRWWAVDWTVEAAADEAVGHESVRVGRSGSVAVVVVVVAAAAAAAAA